MEKSNLENRLNELEILHNAIKIVADDIERLISISIDENDTLELKSFLSLLQVRSLSISLSIKFLQNESK